MNEKRCGDDERTEDPAERLYSEIAPYLSDPFKVKQIIIDAHSSPDAESYVEGEIEKSTGSLRMDLRIVLNRLKKI